jgi:hypothetical protein
MTGDYPLLWDGSQLLRRKVGGTGAEARSRRDKNEGEFEGRKTAKALSQTARPATEQGAQG